MIKHNSKSFTQGFESIKNSPKIGKSQKAFGFEFEDWILEFRVYASLGFRFDLRLKFIID